jgi:hypothetical protein
MKPVMNIDEVKFDDVEENGMYTYSRGQISDNIGAKATVDYYDRERTAGQHS